MSRNYSIPQLRKGSWGIELSVQVQYHLFYFLHRIWKDPGALCGFNPVPGATRLSSALPPSPNPGAGPEGALSKRLDKIFFFFFCAKLPVLCGRAWSLLQDSIRGNCSATAKLSLSAKLLPCCSFMSAFSLHLVHLEEKKKK